MKLTDEFKLKDKILLGWFVFTQPISMDDISIWERLFISFKGLFGYIGKMSERKQLKQADIRLMRLEGTSFAPAMVIACTYEDMEENIDLFYGKDETDEFDGNVLDLGNITFIVKHYKHSAPDKFTILLRDNDDTQEEIDEKLNEIRQVLHLEINHEILWKINKNVP